MYLLPPFILQNFKRILRSDTVIWCTIFGPKMTHLSWTIFFGTKHYYYFHLPVGPFHWAKFKKILTADPKLWGCAIFGPKMVHLPQTSFFSKIINIIFIYLLVPSIAQNFKKILPADPELWCAIFGAKMAHFLHGPFIHTYLHAKNQSEI